MAKSKLVKANEHIAEKVVGGYKKIEDTVVGGYRKIEDAFVDQYLTHDGESVEDAKERLHAEQQERQEQTQGQCGSYAAQGSDYARMAQKHAMEHVRMAQEMAHVPGRKK